jgi:hypothetical protein
VLAKINALTKFLLTAFFAVSIASSQFANAQDANSDPLFEVAELDQILAPIALYPDELLSKVLMASTYPLELVQAARWQKDPNNARLKGDALTRALEAKDWDPSVKSLTQFPDVLEAMSDKLDWTQKLGDAFLAQEDDVFARIQFLRQKADEAGNLKTTKQHRVSKQSNPETQTQYIIIEPTQPDIIFVPVYQPAVVYGAWWYPAYPPYYWNRYPGSVFVSGFFWGAGFAIASDLWGWGNCNWRRGNIDIDINRYNNINVNRPKITSNTWNHDVKHRGPVPYRDKATREKFGKADNLKAGSKDFRGFDKGKISDGGADRVKDKLGDGTGAKIKDKTGDRISTDRAKDKIGDGSGPKLKDKAGGSKSNIATKDFKAAKTKKVSKAPSAKALDVRPKGDVKKHVDRGNISRKSAISHPKAGGAKVGGGRGGGRR